jgi:hypothetical protein
MKYGCACDLPPSHDAPHLRCIHAGGPAALLPRSPRSQPPKELELTESREAEETKLPAELPTDVSDPHRDWPSGGILFSS